MAALWIRVRKFGAGMMLLAAFAFAFHNAVVAADLGECGIHLSGVTHVHAHHAEGDAHVHLADAHGGDHAASKDAGHPLKVPCCGSACTVAVLSAETALLPIRSAAMKAVLQPAPELQATEPRGLKRPPRSLLLG